MGETRRITVTFPADLLNELDKLAPPRKRSQIIVQATAEYVRRLKLLAAIKETSGAWDDASHPELASADDIERWMRQMRGTWPREVS
jgi:metal-responsive CopG/Arc/MetJ family transcriptional regulator